MENGGAVLDQQQVRELSQPFRRIGADRIGSDKGSGLGLSIVAAIAEAHGGSLDLQARPEGGLRVSIELPAAAASGRSAGVRVLVVEDSRSLAEVLVEGLRDQGMAVDAAHDGLEAAAKLDLNALRRRRPRPRPARHPRRRAVPDDHRPGRPGHGPHADRGRRARRPGDRPRPRRRRLPRQAVPLPRACAAHPRARPPAAVGTGRVLRAAGIELDPLRRTVSRDGRLLDLSVKEFGVLEALMLAAPAFLQAEDLLEQVWDEQADPFTNTVTVTVGRLRRKLGDPPVIATTPGVGYRIAAAG